MGFAGEGTAASSDRFFCGDAGLHVGVNLGVDFGGLGADLGVALGLF